VVGGTRLGLRDGLVVRRVFCEEGDCRFQDGADRGGL
jgi:hypothetical protein